MNLWNIENVNKWWIRGWGALQVQYCDSVRMGPPIALNDIRGILYVRVELRAPILCSSGSTDMTRLVFWSIFTLKILSPCEYIFSSYIYICIYSWQILFTKAINLLASEADVDPHLIGFKTKIASNYIL